MSNDTIAYYGAVLSTIVFIWKLIDEWKNRKGNIKVETNFTTQFSIMNNGKTSDSEKMLSITITNFGRSIRHINCPNFITNSKNVKLKYFEIIDSVAKQQYPKQIEPGEIHIVRFQSNNFKFDELDANKIKVNVNDTLKKSYQSKWINVTDFRTEIN